ncbi:hypothetical protein [Oecophyllibacter saccharovorans]|uniref:Uncharacterized protein n=1 Tax=Oecophyllibacter saccharovorans TaxID=2558360 RepID=A0A506UKP4_9PROT|nr:hypothetical protein [Oecophyllibacter saccharovorans]TPW33909.1 hypothetical protein E3202_04785 [Oecophyllibacter saccharovorans]TPW35252.1 hypothetical protein E3203_07300 [Oecophyllibacter saccharovorans]
MCASAAVAPTRFSISRFFTLSAAIALALGVSFAAELGLSAFGQQSSQAQAATFLPVSGHVVAGGQVMGLLDVDGSVHDQNGNVVGMVPPGNMAAALTMIHLHAALLSPDLL